MLEVTIGLVQVITGLVFLSVGVFYWGTAEKTTKRYARGVLLIVAGVVVLALIPLFRLLTWTSSFGG